MGFPSSTGSLTVESEEHVAGGCELQPQLVSHRRVAQGNSVSQGLTGTSQPFYLKKCLVIKRVINLVSFFSHSLCRQEVELC